MGRFITATGVCAVTLMLASVTHAVTTFDDNVTPDILFGAGNANGFFTVDREGSVEVGLRAKQRFPVPANVFNSNGDGTYSFKAGQGALVDDPLWNFEWSVNTDWDGGSGDDLNDFTYRLEIDYDPSAGTDFLAWDHISSPTTPIPYTAPINPGYYDHSIGDNTTTNGNGMEANSAATYAPLVAGNNVAQNSWRHSFWNQPPFAFDPHATGTYDIRLTVLSGVTVVAQVTIQVLVDGDVTPDVIFGSGNINGNFTLDRTGSVELGLRTKQRFPVPANVFNNNFDGTYTWEAGLGQAPDHPFWNFEWSVNTDYNGASGDNLSDLSYLMEIDYDPGVGTNFLAWDHISVPTAPIPFTVPFNPGSYDHAIGDNTTTNGNGTDGTPGNYAALIAGDNNVAQNSWRMSFFNEPPFGFDPNAIGRYDIRLSALNGMTVVAQVAIQVKVVISATCTMNSECDDGLACNGIESCNLGTNTCDFGTAVVCNDQCETGTCIEPTGACQPVTDGTVCTATPDSCTVADTCQTGTCTDGGGGDPDSDGVCSTDDNCPSDANPGQDDADNDGEGDVCDADDAEFNPTRVRIVRERNGNDGRTSVRGDFLAVAPPFTIGSSVSITVEDNLGLNQQQTWMTAQCITRPSGRIACRDTTTRSRAVFKPFLGGQTWKFSVLLRSQMADPPFQGPVTVTLTQTDLALDRAGELDDCQARPSGLVCREF